MMGHQRSNGFLCLRSLRIGIGSHIIDSHLGGFSEVYGTETACYLHAQLVRLVNCRPQFLGRDLDISFPRDLRFFLSGLILDPKRDRWSSPLNGPKWTHTWTRTPSIYYLIG